LINITSRAHSPRGEAPREPKNRGRISKSKGDF
jgi:hypothetical protein